MNTGTYFIISLFSNQFNVCVDCTLASISCVFVYLFCTSSMKINVTSTVCLHFLRVEKSILVFIIYTHFEDYEVSCHAYSSQL